ncbi:hypothetical protein ASD93_08485 [Microbacterium sp. Root180]|nr:hypothetical protein ASD93_08485 [Microbacterium sp. Root180]
MLEEELHVLDVCMVVPQERLQRRQVTALVPKPEARSDCAVQSRDPIVPSQPDRGLNPLQPAGVPGAREDMAKIDMSERFREARNLVSKEGQIEVSPVERHDDAVTEFGRKEVEALSPVLRSRDFETIIPRPADHRDVMVNPAQAGRLNV